MQPIVLVGHRHSCPIHGEGTVSTGAVSVAVDGKSIARIGDSITCGAVIETGSNRTFIEGKAAARKGDRTSHGGTVIEGYEGWLVE